MSEIDASRSHRANIDESVIDIYNELREETKDKAQLSLERAPFPTLKDIFMYAACIGFQKSIRKKMPSGRKTTIRLEVFSENDIALLKSIAIGETGDVIILSNVGEVLTIAEEYAHAGILELKDELLERGGKPLWNLVSLVTS